MKYPANTALARKHWSLYNFAGLNRMPGCAPNEAADMGNLTSAYTPVLAQRPSRSRICRLTSPHGLCGGERLIWADGTDLYDNGQRAASCSDTDKTFVNMGSLVIIFPDKVIYNPKNGTVAPMEAEYSSQGEVSVCLAQKDGTPYGDYSAGSVPPENPQDGDIWVDTSRNDTVLKRFSHALATWMETDNGCIRMDAVGIGADFQSGNSVTISGCTAQSLNGKALLEDAQEDSVLVQGLIAADFTQNDTLHISRTVPDLVFPLVYGNRLWGCVQDEHAIYASKLGDPSNFYQYSGISTDSYAISCGTAGDFTGSAILLGHPVFFTQDAILTLYGNRPSNYSLSETQAPGILAGCERSARVVNDALYYVSARGVYAYRGALPEKISLPFGEEKFRSARAGVLGDEYYLSYSDADGTPQLAVYDTLRGLWHRQDHSRAMDFAQRNGELYMLTEPDGSIWSLTGSCPDFCEAVPEGDVEWYWESGELLRAQPERNSLLSVCLSMECVGSAKLRILYDGNREETLWYEEEMNGQDCYRIETSPRRFRTMKLCLSGKGKIRLYGIYLLYQPGSEASDG